ncbi:hypothetical protein [Lactobacillus xujianguonis]|uniref:hypothetical protein n=1 Tax=Lactobacillus xujianguonis TaxID=2495899 RepID=UPI00143DCA2D|nr:hypothetical protein [Lactobacillus xujianguonis]
MDKFDEWMLKFAETWLTDFANAFGKLLKWGAIIIGTLVVIEQITIFAINYLTTLFVR